eukprot:2349245-Amphidinium_carterae.2
MLLPFKALFCWGKGVCRGIPWQHCVAGNTWGLKWQHSHNSGRDDDIRMPLCLCERIMLSPGVGGYAAGLEP